MAVALTNIFGSEIKVTAQPRDVHRQYSHFAGANGLTAMHMGSRGHRIIIEGIIRAASRPFLRLAVLAIEDWLYAGAVDYTFAGCTYYAVVWERFELQRDGSGKSVYWSSEGWVLTRFTAYGRALI